MTCRICLESESESPELLTSTCGCSGSCALVHLTCLQHWVDVSGARCCEICCKPYKHPSLVFTTNNVHPRLSLCHYVLAVSSYFAAIAQGLSMIILDPSHLVFLYLVVFAYQLIFLLLHCVARLTPAPDVTSFLVSLSWTVAISLSVGISMFILGSPFDLHITLCLTINLVSVVAAQCTMAKQGVSHPASHT